MTSFFYLAGLPWRTFFAPCFPMTWAYMERAALYRHAYVFGNPHYRAVRAFYRGRW
jgi:hypothetical protein